MAKKTKLTNLIIVDASGSMRPKQDEVVGGLKELFKKIKADAIKDKKVITPTTIVVDFSSSGDFNVLVNSSDSKELTDKVAESYSTRGMTALYDAIGKGFNLVGKDQEAVFVNIITDGAENDSKEFNGKLIKDLIKDARSKSWAIVFMGTTEDSINQATHLGIPIGSTLSFANTAGGTKKALKKMNDVRSYYNMTVSSMSKDMDFSSQRSSINTDNLIEDSEEDKN